MQSEGTARDGVASPLSRIQPALSLIAHHPDKVFDLNTLSRRAGLSTFHWHRLFSAAVGESPKQFSQRLRLSRAAALLLSSDDSVLDVALSCGFDSHEGFTRAFRRRFGMSPQSYRSRGLAGTVDRSIGVRHAQVVNKVAPCVGLFHADCTRGKAPQRSDMSYVIEKRVLSPQPVIVVRRRIKRSEVAQTIMSVLPMVFEYAQQHGKALAAHPLTRYVEPGFGMMTIEPGFAIVGPPGTSASPSASPAHHAANDGGAVEDVLPGGPAATTIHHGPYDKLPDAYEAVQAWIERHGFESAGAPWENYVTDPGDVPDPKDWQTEVCWPIRAAATP